MPLRTEGRAIGALVAIRSAGRPSFGEADRDLMQELADRATMAIERSRLHQSESDARGRAELLYRLAAGVIGADRLEQLFETALDGLQSALGAERSSILSTDPDGAMRFRAWRNLSEDYRAAVEGLSPWLPDVPDPGPVVLEDVGSDPKLAALMPDFGAESIGTVAFFPLVTERHLIGTCVVYFREPRELADHELAMAQAIADHVAAAVGRFAAIAELRETVHFNEMFTGMLGHDLRNPLGSIMTAAQLAVLRSSEERLTVPLTRILRAGARMARMIDQLLDFTRVRVGAGIPLDAGPANVASILREVIDELDDAHPEWTFRLERNGDTRGTWDRDRLSQVFSNLVANAVQHGIPEHGASVRINGTAPDQVTVEVHNQGTIPPAQLPHVFEAMSGGERARASSAGLGLGLFISRQILLSHRGDITVESTDSAGTTFTVCLPRHYGRERES
ncbi:MAG: sensor histidine kinase [Gemmatimonadales bacterium]|nr:MAG: sensor histidine kinase [Gemmatimonadales bacterium]